MRPDEWLWLLLKTCLWWCLLCDGPIEHPADALRAFGIRHRDAKADDAAGEDVHYDHDPVAFEQNRFARRRGLEGQHLLLQYKPTTPLCYWLSGGLRPWSLLPESAWKCATKFDKLLLRVSPHFGSFVEIVLLKSDG
ncbi:MAG: hypothetical protein ACLQAT_04655 [Candidatus Binataceae bacterium]